jgi:uncharacterized membrane protein
MITILEAVIIAVVTILVYTLVLTIRQSIDEKKEKR